MYIMTSRLQTRISVQSPYGGVTDWYPELRLCQPLLSLFRQIHPINCLISGLDDGVAASFQRIIGITDLLPPRKRFRDSISPKESVEEDIDTNVLEDIEADATAVEDEVEDEVESSDRGTMKVRVDVYAGINILVGMLIPDAVDHLEQVDEGLQDIYEHVIEIPLQRIEDIETGQRELDLRSLIAGGERASLLEQVASLERSNARLRGTMMMERARADRFWRRVSFMESELRQIRRFRYYDRMRFRRLETFAVRRLEHDYHSFCRNGSDGDNGNGRNGNGENGNGENENPNENNRDARWFEKMETVFHISNYPEKYQVKYATCTLLKSALTWRNSHKRIVGAEAAFAMSWRELMKLMAENNDLAAYTQRFQELTMMCTNMVPEEEDQVEKFIGGLPDNIQGNVIAAEPIRLQDTVRIANNLMDQKLKGYAVKNAENKRRLEVNQRDNRGQQPPFKRPNIGGQNVARAYTAGNNERKSYNGPSPLCNKCKIHHEGSCTVRSDCPKLKDQNHGNKARNKNGIGEARGKVYVLGANRSLVSTTFSTLLDITPDTLDVSYAVELADERISE
ncbi:hypothetical protein Tco_0784162, partial [Tanacetum coccineum]